LGRQLSHDEQRHGDAIRRPLYERESTSSDSARAGAQPNEGDPHLRNIATLTGYRLHATDGEIGHVEDFLVDDASWNIRLIRVDTRSWSPGEPMLISPRSVREIDWADKLIHLEFRGQKVKDSPPSIRPSRSMEPTKKSS
jgi:hypothetical protein